MAAVLYFCSSQRTALCVALLFSLLQGLQCAEDNHDVAERVSVLDRQFKMLLQITERTDRAISKLLTAFINKGDEWNGGSSHVAKRQVLADTLDDGLSNLIDQLSIDDLRDIIRGRDGRDGLPGLPGRDGEDGQHGNPGRDGLPGLAGREGRDGEDGEPGEPGRDGDDGEPGTPGRDGTPGEEGNSGSVYTRWGRKTCAGNSSLIYEGFAASAAHNVTGGGTNYQCLPLNPQEDQHLPPDTGSIISGAEYLVNKFGPYPEVAHGQNVPCARCFSPRSALMMLPARSGCPAGWNTEYHGYLMSANIHNPHPATYECMDINPEYVTGQAGYNHGALFFFVKPDCGGSGSIGHCPPYSGDKKLLCSVCTK